MLFASDLDQTLIYSRRFIEELEQERANKLRMIEIYDGKEISWITENTIQKLKDVCQRALFVPITTRTIAQFSRISLFHKEIRPKYVVTSNGGNILENGSINKDWNTQVKKGIKHNCLPMPDILREFSKIKHDEWVNSQKIADDLFVYCIVKNDKLPQKEIQAFAKWAEIKNWRVFLHGRKLYIIPNVVNKGDALKYIQGLENKEIIIAAGDSLLDLDMLKCAHLPIIAGHGEVLQSKEVSTNPPANVYSTKFCGILAAEEILSKVVEVLDKMNKF